MRHPDHSGPRASHSVQLWPSAASPLRVCACVSAVCALSALSSTLPPLRCPPLRRLLRSDRPQRDAHSADSQAAGAAVGEQMHASLGAGAQSDATSRQGEWESTLRTTKRGHSQTQARSASWAGSLVSLSHESIDLCASSLCSANSAPFAPATAATQIALADLDHLLPLHDGSCGCDLGRCELVHRFDPAACCARTLRLPAVARRPTCPAHTSCLHLRRCAAREHRARA